MWELANARAASTNFVEEYLKEGYEPFAVSTDSNGFITIWFKREVKVEIHSQQGSDKGTSRRATKTAKS